MKSVKVAAAAGLALALAACGGGADDASAPAENGGEGAAGIELAASATTPATGSADQAPVAFAQCKACHSVEPGKMGIGPSLHGIYGTTAGDIEGFQFSSAMKESGLVWDDKTLDAYLENPQKVVPGTKMSFFGLKDAAKRHEVIEYLKTLK